MTPVTEPPAAPPAPPPPGRTRPVPTAVFAVLGVVTFALAALMNWMLVVHAPAGVKGIGASYLIMYYHVPSAALMLLGYLALGVCGAFQLATGGAKWDLWGRVTASVALLANAIVLLTGAVWGKAAWNVWWRFDDPKLTTAAVVFLVYLGYFILHRGIEDPVRRPRICAIYGVIASPSYILVKYSIDWFGSGSHPPKVDFEGSGIWDTFLVAHLAFFGFYAMLWLWKLDTEALRERAEAALMRVRRLEDARS